MGRMSRRPCGNHVTLSENDGARVSRCACGTLHVLIKPSGVTVQLNHERFHELGLAVMGAVSALGATTTPPPGRSGRTIN
jgi:hypothetical protein